MSSFPRSITWLVRQMYTALIEKKLISKEEAALICTDLIFTYFLCSAIINPEPLGIISDTPISYIARFNLIQIGQIMHTLAILPYEQRVPSYFGEILSRLDKESMTTVMNSILCSESASIETIFPVCVPDSNDAELFKQTAFMGTLREINILQAYLKSTAVDAISDAALRKSLKNMMKRLPDEFLQNANFELSTPDRTQQTVANTTSATRLRNFADKVQNVASRGHQRLMQTSSVTNLRNLNQRVNLTSSLSSNVLANDAAPAEATGGSQQVATDKEDDIKNPLVLTFPIPERNEPIGMATEEEVLELFRRIQSKRRKLANGEKKTRFLAATESIVSDRTTTDVISDEDEEEGELDEGGAASSVSSSNENAADEEVEDISTLPDNFSDVVPISANVSGRGSPSFSGGRLSGRETPFSANALEQNEAATICSTVPAIASQPAEPRKTLPTIPVTVRKQNTEGLEEKFGKFGLPPQDPSRYRDETVSLVSDSWSTDVVASDNEGLGELRNPAELLLQPIIATLQNAAVIVPPTLNPVANHQPAGLGPQQQNASVRAQPHSSTTLAATVRQANISTVAASTNAATGLQQESSSSIPHSSLSAPPSFSHTSAGQSEERPYFDSENLTKCRAFLDAKRKLRLVLSCTSAVVPHCPSPSTSQQQNGTADKLLNCAGDSQTISTPNTEMNALGQFLKLLLAESINNRDRRQAAQIRDVQRCLSMFDPKGVRSLLRTMRDEHRKRTAYLCYLQQSRLTLLQLDFCLERVDKRVARVKSLTAECLINMLVRFNLQGKDQFQRQFVHDFRQLNVQDEKIDLVESRLQQLCEQIVFEPMWRFASLENLEYARKCLERSLMAHIYGFSLFPNGEADYYRDEVLNKSIQELTDKISVDHPELGIPKSLHAESPWPSAQAELSIINAYKSPRDKMACITKCCETIENLITLASSHSTASADDILPILVFVILKANPPSLLSNMQFIDSFYAKRMQGGEAYWWTQFGSAVEFLKTLLNKLCN